jgi:hypothetical protein
LYDGKRYRIHNNYLTAGVGYFGTNLRSDIQRPFGLDFQFHIKTHHFQLGGLISGNDLFGVNNISFHTGYGWRKETTKSNLAIFAGLNYSYGVYPVLDTANTALPKFYNNIGAYICAQAIKKLTYDIGIGLEFYGEINETQVMGGIKFLLFFSGSYRGVKRNYNPNVKNQK